MTSEAATFADDGGLHGPRERMSAGLRLYLVFSVSWFLHVPARFEFLGVLRVDLVLVLILIVLALSGSAEKSFASTSIDKRLKWLLVYAVLSVPLVYWPGSVVKAGLPNFIKAVVFYYFTVAFVKTESDLRRFVLVFVGCQLFRVLEPLYLHVTQGYWGSVASMAGWEYLERLSGAPSDVVNPNGLAYVVCTLLPFLYFLAPLSRLHALVSLVTIPLAVYVLALTGSRSGMIGLGVVIAGVVLKSKRRLTLSVAIVIAAVASFPLLSADMQDRYLSIFGKGEKNAGTADDRMEGMLGQFDVVLHRPLFGHGLGTSPEANAHFSSGPYAGTEMPAHNLFIEIGQELGLVGVALFLLFMQSIYAGFEASKRAVAKTRSGTYIPRLIDALQVWLWMNLIFSFASYGLSSYEWYLSAGLSVVIFRLTQRHREASRTGSAAQTAPSSMVA